ncbi:MAG: class I SAM-dependent methyltransferase [Bacteroidales bacterium]
MQYRLLDCGEGEKLEQWGSYVTIRPEPHARWPRSKPLAWWKEQAHWFFEQGRGKGVPGREDSGTWRQLKEAPSLWTIDYKGLFKMRVGPMEYKHVGIFPEQAPNWDFIYNKIEAVKIKTAGVVPWVLNLFAYTGAASLAAKAAGAEVVHLDALRQMVSRSRENMDLSGLSGIRWVVEDALTFVQREVRRGNTYHGIILDPPAFGHGPGGERWKLQEDLPVLLEGCFRILDEKHGFLVLNVYAHGFTAEEAARMVRKFFPGKGNITFGTLYLKDNYGKKLSAGIFSRLEL